MMTVSTVFQFVAAIAVGFAACFWRQISRTAAPKELQVATWGDANNPYSDHTAKRWAREINTANRNGAICAAISFAAQFLGLTKDMVTKWGAPQ